MDTRKCGKCDLVKTVDQFYKKRRNKNGTIAYQSYCISCCSKRHKKYFQANRGKYLDKAKKHREKLINFVNSLKDQPCVDCKQSHPPYVMDFDHLDSTTKVDTISRLQRTGSKELIIEEIKKCELVCSNCHRERTYQRAHE